MPRVAQVDYIQRVGLLERDHVTEVPDEADGVDFLAPAQAVERPDCYQGTVFGLQDANQVVRKPGRGCAAVGRSGRWLAPGGGYPEVAPVLGHGVLANQRARHAAGSQVPGSRGV